MLALQARQPSFGERVKVAADSGEEKPAPGPAPRSEGGVQSASGGLQSEHDDNTDADGFAGAHHDDSGRAEEVSADRGSRAEEKVGQRSGRAHSGVRKMLNPAENDLEKRDSAHEDVAVKVPLEGGDSGGRRTPEFGAMEAVPPHNDQESDPSRTWSQTGLFITASCLEAATLALAAGLLTQASRRRDYDGVEVRCWLLCTRAGTHVHSQMFTMQTQCSTGYGSLLCCCSDVKPHVVAVTCWCAYFAHTLAWLSLRYYQGSLLIWSSAVPNTFRNTQVSISDNIGVVQQARCALQVWLGVLLAPPFALTRWWLGGLLNDLPKRVPPTLRLAFSMSICRHFGTSWCCSCCVRMQV